jgi:ribA/ribD-fused uncharacterized protein
MTSGLQREPVRFHRIVGENSYLTTYSRCPIIIDGTVWATCEHYFEAAKFPETHHAQLMRHASTPIRATSLGRTRTETLRADWASVRVHIMRTAMRAKFVQYPCLARELLATGDRPLIRTNPEDYFWGVGHAGTGRNIAGKLLNDIRADLNTDPPWIPPDDFNSWVAFGDSTIVLLADGWARDDVNLQAHRFLVQAGSGGSFDVRETPTQYLRVYLSESEDQVLLRLPTVNRTGQADLPKILREDSFEPITWIHDLRWPRLSPQVADDSARPA